MNAGDAEAGGAVGVAVTMTVADVFEQLAGSLGVEVAKETEGALPSHVEAAKEQHARDAERAKALDLAKAEGEAVRRRLEAPGDGGEGQDVRGEVRDAVPGVGRHGL